MYTKWILLAGKNIQTLVHEKYRIKKQLKNFAIPRRFSGNGKTINSYPADTVKE